MSVVRIVPGLQYAQDGAQYTVGTRLFVDDIEIDGVVRIELTAEISETWRATVVLSGCRIDAGRMKASEQDGIKKTGLC